MSGLFSDLFADMFGKKSAKDKGAVTNTTIGSGINSQFSHNILSKDKLREALAPDGINPNSLDHLVLSDSGQTLYIRSFYVETVPSTVYFADTFAPLFNSPNVTSSVFISPMDMGKAQNAIDRKLTVDEAEYTAARNAGRANDARKLEEVFVHDQKWAVEFETGRNKLFEVGFLFTLREYSLSALNKQCSDFVFKARSKGITLVSCYGLQSEAYLSNCPINRVYGNMLGIIKMPPVKYHPFDLYSTASLFNHTNNSFSHPSGIVAGRNMYSGEPILWDPYAKSHAGFSALFVGKTGTGKSATIKMYVARLSLFDYRFAAVDTDKSGGVGEYVPVCERLGGVAYELSASSSNRLNIFELDEQLTFDKKLGHEIRTLRLMDKCAGIYNIIMSALVTGKASPDFALHSAIEAILKAGILAVYTEKGFVDGKADSIYESTSGVSGQKKRKLLPTISDLYLNIAAKRAANENPLLSQAFQIVTDSLADLVDDLWYDPLKYVRVDAGTEGACHVSGTKGYFDGQSSVHISKNIPFVDIDISNIPEADRLLGQQVAMSFLSEHFVQKNSENIRDAKKMVFIFDEAHRHFSNPVTCQYLSDQIRTARKNNVSLWLGTQAHKDFDLNENTRAILKNVSSIFMFKQDPLDRDYLNNNTVLTPVEVSRVISLGGDPNDTEDKAHKGEICLIDMDRAVFLKVDYLQSVEAQFVETDVQKKKAMERG